MLPEGLPRLVTHHLGLLGGRAKGCHKSPIGNHLVPFIILYDYLISFKTSQNGYYIYIDICAVSAFGSANFTH